MQGFELLSRMSAQTFPKGSLTKCGLFLTRIFSIEIFKKITINSINMETLRDIGESIIGLAAPLLFLGIMGAMQIVAPQIHEHRDRTVVNLPYIAGPVSAYAIDEGNDGILDTKYFISGHRVGGCRIQTPLTEEDQKFYDRLK